VFDISRVILTKKSTITQKIYRELKQKSELLLKKKARNQDLLLTESAVDLLQYLFSP
jgi:hypothetical protein